MTIHGLQKMTLLDYPGKVACTVFSGGCNLRCPFCHNALLVTELDRTPALDTEEVADFLKKRAGLLDGVCFTGGEPLLQPDLPDFIRRIRSFGYAIKLDTNGTFPDRLAALLDGGLVDYVAMDIKNRPEKYPMTAGIPDLPLENVKKSVSILQAGKTDHEFRTTVVNEYHTVDDIEAIARWIEGAPRYFLQCFKDSGELIGTGLTPPSAADLAAMQTAADRFVPTQIRGTD